MASGTPAGDGAPRRPLPPVSLASSATDPTASTGGRLLPALALVLLGLGCYAGSLGRGFTSEDFLLIRVLAERPPWHDLRGLFGEPWLGIAGIQFWRPVSTLLYGLEIFVFGARAPAYNFVHLAVHLASCLLLWTLARRLLALPMPRERTGPSPRHAAMAAWWVAAAFAVYPLHPNAVLFSASFATVFAGLFLLAALAAYDRATRGGGWPWWLAAVAAFALALGSYEAAAVLPAWLAAHELLVAPRGEPSDQPWRRQLLRWSAFPALLAAYLLLRRQVFGGAVVGGYAATRERLSLSRLHDLGGDLLTSIGLLPAPRFTLPPSVWAVALSLALLVILPVILFTLRRRTPAGRLWRPWLLGWAIAISSLAPFAFEPVVPGNGRYWYLAVIGLCLSLGATLAALAALGRTPAKLAALLALLLLASWTLLLLDNLAVSRRAADAAERLRLALLAQPPSRDGRPFFVTGYPYFLTNQRDVPLAQVYHYGLRDAAGPPFSSRQVDVYPLTPLHGDELLPLSCAGVRVLTWRAAGPALAPAAVPASSEAVELAVLAPPDPQDQLRVAVAVPESELRSSPKGPPDHFRMLLSAPINGTVIELGETALDGVLLTSIPADFLTTSRALYRRPIYWWLEARAEDGRLTGFTRLRVVPDAPPTAPQTTP